MRRARAESKVRNKNTNDNVCQLRRMRSEGGLPGDSPGQERAGSADERSGGGSEDLRADPEVTRRDVPEDKKSPNLSTRKSSMKTNEEDFYDVGRDRQTQTFQKRQILENVPHVWGDIEAEDNTFGGRRRV